MSEEGKIQAKAIRYAKKRGLLVKRNYMRAGAETGWPDIEIFLPGGKTLFMEFKAPGKGISKIQSYRIDQLKALGHHVVICDSYDAAEWIIFTYDTVGKAGASAVDPPQVSGARRTIPD